MIVFPMAGQSSRFARSGYEKPKYMLPIGETTVFDCAVSGFRSLFASEEFLFIMRDVAGTLDFVRSRVSALGIRNARFVVLEHPTAGQADTVAQGILQSGIDAGEKLVIFNIDTFRLHVYATGGAFDTKVAGSLEVFRGDGDNWSYVEPSEEFKDMVVRTSEKQRISDLCCSGLYVFSDAHKFLDAFERSKISPDARLKEFYVAPLYNFIISDGCIVQYFEVDPIELIFCGVPEEYEAIVRESALVSRLEGMVRGF